MRCATRPGARPRPLPDAKICGEGVSKCQTNRASCLYYITRMSGSEPNVILDGSGGLEIGPLWPDCFFFSSSFQRVFILILEPLRLEVPCFALDDV